MIVNVGTSWYVRSSLIISKVLSLSASFLMKVKGLKTILYPIVPELKLSIALRFLVAASS